MKLDLDPEQVRDTNKIFLLFMTAFVLVAAAIFLSINVPGFGPFVIVPLVVVGVLVGFWFLLYWMVGQ